MSSATILVLGDSLAVSPSRTENFPSELQSRLELSYPGWTVVNAGVFGDTTSGGLQRLDYWLGSAPRVLVLALGANDGLRGVAVATVERNLAQVIERAQSRGTMVVLCGMVAPPIHGWNYSADFQALFARLAGRYKLPLVPFLLQGVILNRAMNGADGIHPNLAGAKAIAALVWPYLEPLLTPATVR